MVDWISCRLADICKSIDYGYTASAINIPAGPKFLRITDIVGGALDWRSVPYVEATKNELDRYRLNHEDIVIARTGATTGESHYIKCPPKSIFASYLVRIKVDEHNDPRYVSYWLKSPEFRNYLSGVLGDKSAQPNASASTMTNSPITIPADLEYQRSISSVLGALDDKIELNRRMNETLEAMARAIFKDWFVDFGPTRAKAEGRPPYLAPELWSLFPERIDDDGKPELWEFGSLDQIVTINPPESLKAGCPAPYLDMAALPTNGPTPEPAINRNFTSGMRFRNGDTLIARITPCLENGKTAFIQNLPPNAIGWGSTEFIVLRAREPVPPQYTYLLARDPTFRACAIQSMTGTSGRQRARNEAIASYPIIKPDDRVWRAFGSIVEPIFDRIKANGVEGETLAQTRDLLLPKLMSGEIRVREAEALVEHAV